MNRYLSALVCLVLFAATPTFGAVADQNRFLMVTITDIGRSYRPIEAGCFMVPNPNFLSKSMASMFSATQSAGSKALTEFAKKLGADAVVGMTITPVLVPDSTNPRDYTSSSGLWICGTLVKFIDTETASLP